LVPFQPEDGPHDEPIQQLALADLHVKPYAERHIKVYADTRVRLMLRTSSCAPHRA